MDSVPVVFLTGQVRTDLLGTDGFQEADVIGITMPSVKHSFMITDPRELPRVIHEAFHIAGSGRPGPVLVDIPTDLFTPIFAIARMSGWTAHVLEQWSENRLFRPLSEYVGRPYGQKVVPIDER